MSRRLALSGLILVLFAALPQAASAAAKLGGVLARGDSENEIIATIVNEGTEDYKLVVLELPPGAGPATEITATPDFASDKVTCTYDAFKNAIVCEFSPMFRGRNAERAGDRVTLKFKTANRIADGAGARAKACRPPCDSPATDTPFFDIPGPSDLVDLVTEKRIGTPALGGFELPAPSKTFAVGAGQRFLYSLVVRNTGPGRARNVVLRDELPEGLKVVRTGGRPEVIAPGNTKCEVVGNVITCTRSSLGAPVGGDEQLLVAAVSVVAEKTGQFTNTATATSDNPESDPADNTSLPLEVTVTEMPDVQGIKGSSTPRSPLAIEGRTQRFAIDPNESGGSLAGQVMRSSAHTSASVADLSKLRRVEVAILRKGIRKGRCRWVKNKRGQLKNVKAENKKCSRGIWLRAKGIDRWRFALSRQLPPGSYTLYARAVNRGGVRETKFSGKDGNTLSFTVGRP